MADKYYKIKAKVGEGDNATEMEVPVVAAKTVGKLTLVVGGETKEFDGSDNVGPISIEGTSVEISVSPETASVFPGGTTTLTATVKVNGDTISNPTISWSSGNTSVATVGSSTGVVTGVAAGSATITASYTSASGSVTASAVATVTVKSVSISLSPTSTTIYVDETATITATVKEAGSTISSPSVSWSVSSGSSYASVSGSGKTGTVTGKAAGTATIKASYTPSSGGTAVTATCTVYVEAKPVTGGSLDDYEWSEIKDIKQRGEAEDYFSVGDRKTIHLDGQIGEEYYDLDVALFIIGFNHNAGLESNGEDRIHFQGFKDPETGEDICLCDSEYGSWHDSSTKYFSMNHWNDYNYGGWGACDMRYDILGSTDQPPDGYGGRRSSGDQGYDANWMNEDCTLAGALPQELKEVMEPLYKYTDNVGGGNGDVRDQVFGLWDYIPLLSVCEVFGYTGMANSYEANYQEQYEYYADGNETIKYNHDSRDAAIWWLRSPCRYRDDGFCGVDEDGGGDRDYAGCSFGLAPACSI